jgi:hydroxymethylpyrimidine pyrophosphatase-like HAD family hydrolase
VTYGALACDYDGTIATDGMVSASTQSALERLKRRDWRLILVTGRMLEDLILTFPGLNIFDRAVVENGAILFSPAQRKVVTLAAPPADSLVQALRNAGVPVVSGRVILATERDWAPAVTAVLAARRISLELVYNRESLMLLPPGVDKASGLHAALEELGVTSARCVAVGDAENDRALLQACGLRVAVGNSVAELRQDAQLVTHAAAGDGVAELIDRLLGSADAAP